MIWLQKEECLQLEKRKKMRASKPFIWKNIMGLGKEAKYERFLKKKNVSPKERHASPRKNGMNHLIRRKMPTRFIIPHIISHGQE